MMGSFTEMETMGQNSAQTKFFIFDLPKINGFLLLSEILLKVSKHFPIIIFSFASLKLLLVVNDVYSNNFVFAILNSIFAFGDFVFLVQIYHRRKFHQKESNLSQNKIEQRLMEDITE